MSYDKGFALGGRPMSADPNHKYLASLPAPNQYDNKINTIAMYSAAPKIGTSQRASSAVKSNQPGPGAFNISFDWEAKSKNGISFGTEKRIAK